MPEPPPQHGKHRRQKEQGAQRHAPPTHRRRAGRHRDDGWGSGSCCRRTNNRPSTLYSLSSAGGVRSARSVRPVRPVLSHAWPRSGHRAWQGGHRKHAAAPAERRRSRLHRTSPFPAATSTIRARHPRPAAGGVYRGNPRREVLANERNPLSVGAGQRRLGHVPSQVPKKRCMTMSRMMGVAGRGYAISLGNELHALLQLVDLGLLGLDLRLQGGIRGVDVDRRLQRLFGLGQLPLELRTVL